MNASELLLKVQAKLAGWKVATLSRGGKLTLLKSNLSGMPNHSLSCLKCPSKITDKLDSECRNFFWGSSAAHPPIAWNHMCLPKSKGGLGIRPAAVFNKAAMAKLAWKIISEPDNWWVKLVILKYLRTNNFFSVPKKSGQSLAWKGILDARSLILEGMQWLVGNGSTINLWTFNWCYPFPLFCS